MTEYSSILLNIWLFLTMLGVGFKISWSELLHIKGIKKELAYITIANVVIIPLFVFGLIWQLEGFSMQAFGILLFTLLPGSPIALKLGDLKGVNLSLLIVASIAMLAFSGVLLPFVLPYLNDQFNVQATVTPLEFAKTVIPQLVLPLSIGISLSQRVKQSKINIAKIVARIGNVLVIGLLVLSMFTPRQNPMRADMDYYILCFVVPVFTFVLISVMGLKKKDFLPVFIGSLINNTALTLIIAQRISDSVFQGALIYALITIAISVVTGQIVKLISQKS